MTTQPIEHPYRQDQPISRELFIRIVQAGLKCNELRFTRQAALAWLAAFPGDLEVNLCLASALFKDNKPAQALPILENLTRTDPEFAEAHQLLEQLNTAAGVSTPKSRATQDEAAALSSHQGRKPSTEWSKQIWEARRQMDEGRLGEANQMVQKSLLSTPESPLPAVYQLRLLREEGNIPALLSLANLYHKKWPDCVQFALYLAEACLEEGEEDTAVLLLHQCLARDAAGLIARRIWGEGHPYQPIWPEKMEIVLDMALPAAVAAEFGWNQLTTGDDKPPFWPFPEDPTIDPNEAPTVAVPIKGNGSKAAPSVPVSEAAPMQPEPKPFVPMTRKTENQKTIQEELDRIAKKLKRPEIARADGRFPMYVILTTRANLDKKYGAQTSCVIESELLHLAAKISRKPGWGALAFFVDDPASTTLYGIKPAPPTDPWKIKLALADLDAALVKKGQMIGCVLIIGNGEVVPFHHLPNPTNDPDHDIESDNPYATRDENYFVPEWPVGRLPGDATPDAGMLLKALRQMAANYCFPEKPLPWWRKFNPLGAARQFLSKTLYLSNTREAFGYTAEIWRKASVASFRPVGETRSVLVSPPTTTGNINRHGLPPARLGYFNLHGLIDSPAWYGQRDSNGKMESPDFPVALTPEDIVNSGGVPRVVLSEACYGANIDKKTENEAIALKFIATGSQAVVGSTCISYGSVTTPLIAADLFGYYFWKEINDGQTAGFAFQKAKLSLAKEMNNRQGYLDGEDQKTLLSFILFGDPLATLNINQVHSKAFQAMRVKAPEINTITDQPEPEDTLTNVPTDVVAQVKQIVNQYLPGLKDADMSMAHVHMKVIGKPVQPADGRKTIPIPENLKVTLTKQVQVNSHFHPQFAHLTLNSQGKVLKLSMSR